MSTIMELSYLRLSTFCFFVVGKHSVKVFWHYEVQPRVFVRPPAPKVSTMTAIPGAAERDKTAVFTFRLWLGPAEASHLINLGEAQSKYCSAVVNISVMQSIRFSSTVQHICNTNQQQEDPHTTRR